MINCICNCIFDRCLLQFCGKLTCAILSSTQLFKGKGPNLENEWFQKWDKNLQNEKISCFNRFCIAAYTIQNKQVVAIKHDN